MMFVFFLDLLGLQIFHAPPLEISQHSVYNELSLFINNRHPGGGRLCQAIMQRPGAVGARLALLVLLTGLSPLCCQLSQSSVSSSLQIGSARVTM